MRHLLLGLLFPWTLIPEPVRDTVRLLELSSEIFGNTRTVRVLLPAGYQDAARAGVRFKVFYFTDGVAAFDPRGWDVPGAVGTLRERGVLADWIFVGIDNGGSTRETTNPVADRAAEYLPYPDQTWTGPDAPDPKGQRFPRFLFDEVMPLINATFATDTTGGATGLAGASYGAVAALYAALQYPARIGYLLLESPPLHIGDRQLLTDAEGASAWPPAIYLGVGTAEDEGPQRSDRVVVNVRELAEIIEAESTTVRVQLRIQEDGTHWYDAWKVRLPGALSFLLAPQ